MEIRSDLIREKVSLRNFNTFGIDVSASFFATCRNEDELKELLNFARQERLPVLILGGGSNVLFTKDFEGLVIRNGIPGIAEVARDDEFVHVTAGSGVVWHDLVNWCISNDFQGIENLSLIPGCAGAAPIQNIGAYGVELKDHFVKLNAVNLEHGESAEFDLHQCEFGYRDSVFKRHHKDKFAITSITLSLKLKPQFKLSYGAISQELQKMGVVHPTIKAVSDAVIRIRQSKLPDPARIGNAGSFFKNPEVDEGLFQMLQPDFPGLVAYPSKPGKMKIAAGWLIEQCGWKGKRIGNTGSHKDQALVLVNYGNATGAEILELAKNISDSVFEKFGIRIEPEVNII